MISPWRAHAEGVIRRTLDRAALASWSDEQTRLELRAARHRIRVTPAASYTTWLRAVRAVTGGGLRDLQTPRQTVLPLGGEP